MWEPHRAAHARGSRNIQPGAEYVNTILALLCFLLLEYVPMDNRPGWTIIGPGGGGAQFHPTISPHDPRFVLVGCDMTGSYVTHDAGRAWRMFNLLQPARFFVFDPIAAQTIYAQSGGF